MTEHNPSGAAVVESVRPRRRSPYWAMAVIFVCGVVVGLGIGVIGLHLFMSHQFRHPEQMYSQLVEKLTTDLQLTPEQQQKVAAITQQKQTEFTNLFTRDFRNLGNAHFDSLRDAVAEALDPDRARRWRAAFEALRARSLPPFPPPLKNGEDAPSAGH